MMIRQRVGVLLVAALISAALAGQSMAADAPKVLNVITVKVKGDQSAYFEKGQETQCGDEAVGEWRDDARVAGHHGGRGCRQNLCRH